MHVDEQPAFLIHSRKYTDSRIIVELLTRDYGRVSGVLRQSAKSKRQTKVQPFSPLIVTWKGKSALKSLWQAEALSAPLPLLGSNLFCGLYLNELLLRCLPQDDSCEPIFGLYLNTITKLSKLGAQPDQVELEKVLRTFEFQFLTELGFGINFESDINEKMITVDAQQRYHFASGDGFIPVASGELPKGFVYSAASLVAIREQNYAIESLRSAKRLSRQAFKVLLGDKPLKTRELFVKP